MRAVRVQYLLSPSEYNTVESPPRPCYYVTLRPFVPRALQIPCGSQYSLGRRDHEPTEEFLELWRHTICVAFRESIMWDLLVVRARPGFGTLFSLPTLVLRTGEASYQAPSATTDI